ncbi:MAG TPA: PQQ-binding-like beta-propeller repeat protein [Candidatus Binatia bacterium]|nr:PQQ-binding-like beta-propeller repeat protein [Candidatus Binatia bacterium]
MAKLLSSLAVVAGLFSATLMPARAVDWPVFGFDPARSSFNSAEHTLTVGNVHMLKERWQVSLGDVSQTPPILLQHVRVGKHYRTMLFETTESGITLGIDASSGHVVWRYTSHGVNITTSAPAADPSGKAIYVPGIDGKVHKLSAARGREINSPGFPARITRMPSSEKVASPLNVANGFLYATTSGYNGDAPPYDGHVVAVNLSSGKTTVFNSLCSNKRRLPGPNTCPQQRSGIWARGGAVVDPDQSMSGRIYAATGNGDFNANQGGHNYGDSVLSLSDDLSNLLGSYTPTDYQGLQDGDVDLGSTSPSLLPNVQSSQTPLMLVQGGKDAILKLLDRAALPGVGGELQLIDLPNGLFSTPAIWSDASGNPWVFMGFSDVVVAYRLQTNGKGVSQLVGVWQASPGSTNGEGTSPVVANGILFVAFDRQIVAMNALNGNVLWSSSQSSAGGTIGNVHWQSPIVVNGSVYCADQSGNLTAYSLH